MRAGVFGVGAALPEQLISNDDLAARLETSDEWIVRRTGIRARRRLNGDDSLARLAAAACAEALADAERTAAEVDRVIVSTITADQVTPGLAPAVAGLLGCEAVAALDLNAACAGFLVALEEASALVESGRASCVLVCGAGHQRRVEGAGDVEPARASVGARFSLGQRVERAGEHQLARGVVVGDREGELGGERPDGQVVAAEEGGHPPGRRFGHRLGAHTHDREGVLELQGLRGDQGGVLAQRVAGGGEDVLGPVALPGGDRAEEQRGLLETGALVKAAERVEAEQLQAALEGTGAAQAGVHAFGMAALPREEDGERFHGRYPTPEEKRRYAGSTISSRTSTEQE